MPPSPSPRLDKKNRWWITNRKVVDRYTREARCLLAAQHTPEAAAALSLLDAALGMCPRHDPALELKARCLLFLRRFRDVADMLQEYIPSYRSSADDEDDEDSGNTTSTSLSSSGTANTIGSWKTNNNNNDNTTKAEKVRLLPCGSEDSGGDRGDGGLSICFNVSDLKKRVVAGMRKHGENGGQWRYIVLGQACFHLGMMADAMVLLQTGRRVAAASCRRESLDLHEDSFSAVPCSLIDLPTANLNCSGSPGGHSPNAAPSAPPSPPLTELESAANLLNHIKQLLRRRGAAHAALDAGLPAESIRHFSKLLDGRRGTPPAFAAACLVGRAAAHRAAGRLADAIADCNRALSVDPASIPALRARADLLESVGSLQDCLRDLEHLKLLYDAILWDRKLPGPPWRPHHGVRYREIPNSLRALTTRIQEMRGKMSRGECAVGAVDYYALFGLKRGCSRSELERTHVLLTLKHRPDKAGAFLERLEFMDDNRDLEAVRDQARMSAMVLYRMLQKGYSSIMATVMEEEAAAAKVRALKEAEAAAAAAEAERKRAMEEAAAAAAAEAAAAAAAAEATAAAEAAAAASAARKAPKNRRNLRNGPAAPGQRKGPTPAPVRAERKKGPTAPVAQKPSGGMRKSGGPSNAATRPSKLADRKASAASATAAAAQVLQGVFCRDLAAVGGIITQAGFTQAIPVKYEALSC